jgi:hypothetical protein
MKQLISILILIWLLPLSGKSQTLQWERTVDFSNNTTTNIDLGGTRDNLLDLMIVDSGKFLASVYCEKFPIVGPGTFRSKPMILMFNSSGNSLDTLALEDTINDFKVSLDRARKRIWVAYATANFPHIRMVIEKINFRGFTIARKDFRDDDFIDSLPGTIHKLLPASDGGFYLLGSVTRRVGTSSTEPWQISRFDSLGNRRWVKEYLYRFAFGNPTGGEFLPNGNLFVSGWAGREIYGLEIDTATGNMVNRKVFFTHPENVGWGSAYLVRSPGGYYIAGGDSRNGANRRFLFGRIVETPDSLRMVWGGFTTLASSFPNPMSDSSVWVARRIQGGNYQYFRFGSDSTLRIQINLSSNIQNDNSYTTIGNVAHFNDQSAIFGGNIQTSTTQGTALYFCKIDSIGTPYNPVYPPVGPVLSSNQKQKQEPNLQVYPNPFTNTLRLSHKGNAQLLDVHGRVIISQPVEAGEELNVGNLPKGMYLLRLQSVGGKLYVRKVIKE